MQNGFSTIIGFAVAALAVFGVLRVVLSPKAVRRPHGASVRGWDSGNSLGADGTSDGHHGHDCGSHDGGGHDGGDGGGDCGGGDGD